MTLLTQTRKRGCVPCTNASHSESDRHSTVVAAFGASPTESSQKASPSTISPASLISFFFSYKTFVQEQSSLKTTASTLSSSPLRLSKMLCVNGSSMISSGRAGRLQIGHVHRL